MACIVFRCARSLGDHPVPADTNLKVVGDSLIESFHWCRPRPRQTDGMRRWRGGGSSS